MVRRFTVLAFAVAALAQTGCHGRVCNFFYRLTHCCDCCPSYGYGGGGATYHGGPTYGQPCCNTPMAAPMGQPVFSGMPQPMPGPNVYPTPAPPPAAGTGDKK